MVRPRLPLTASTTAALAALAGLPACRDVSRFESRGDHFEGSVVEAPFVRRGVDPGVRLCLTLDTDHLQDAPGVISTSDGRLRAAPLRPVPELWHDPLSMLAFGDGRVRNLVYMARPAGDAGGEPDVTAVVSLLQSGDVEVRLVRGAPDPASSAEEPSRGAPVFAVFPLTRAPGACSF